MTEKADNLYEALERIFHEPNRLSIMSALAASDKGLTFTELREQCRLTDGNLNRHLKALEESRVVKIRKAFVDAKPQTTIAITSVGLERFSQYLAALSEVLKAARKAVQTEKEGVPCSANAVRARA